MVLVYVDNLIITGDLDEMIRQLKENMCTIFNMKDLGQLKYFLGLEICYKNRDIILHQSKYTNVKLHVDVGRKLEDPTMYRKIVGNLIYLTLIRPDIAFIVGVLSRYMQTPRKPQLDAIRRVIRYVKTTLSYGVFFKRDSECKLLRYCDAEYEGDVNTQ